MRHEQPQISRNAWRPAASVRGRDGAGAGGPGAADDPGDQGGRRHVARGDRAGADPAWRADITGPEVRRQGDRTASGRPGPGLGARRKGMRAFGDFLLAPTTHTLLSVFGPKYGLSNQAPD